VSVLSGTPAPASAVASDPVDPVPGTPEPASAVVASDPVTVPAVVCPDPVVPDPVPGTPVSASAVVVPDGTPVSASAVPVSGVKEEEASIFSGCRGLLSCQVYISQVHNCQVYSC